MTPVLTEKVWTPAEIPCTLSDEPPEEEPERADDAGPMYAYDEEFNQEIRRAGRRRY